MTKHRMTPRQGLAIATVAATGVALGHRLLVADATGRRLDDLAAEATDRTARRRADRLLSPYRPLTYALACTALGVVGLATRGPVRTACGSAALVGTVATAEMLKAGLPRPGGGHLRNSYPSGHTAGIGGLAAMALVLAPEQAAAVSAVGASATLAVGAATVVARWHRPSDVVGAALVAVAWGAAGLAVADAISPRPS